MEGQQPPGGRARGRGRSTSRPDRSQPPQQQQAWVRPGVPPQQSESSYGPPTSRGVVRTPMPHQSSQGDRAPGQQQQPSTSTSVGGGDAAATRSMGRGAMRGNKMIVPEIFTRPEHTRNSKKGTIGQPINLEANFFKILNAPDWCLFQYRVDFAPEEDRNAVRKGLLRLHKDRLGTYIFDGTVMYTCNRYANVSTTESMKLTSKRESDDATIEISVRLVGEMSKGDPHYLQLYNILLRRGLEHLRLQLVGRNYFDARAKIEIREFRLELWPGYQTSIRQHERNILMGVEITSKVMRQETLLDILNNVRQRVDSGDLQAACRAEVIGLTVLTDYNNNTYRVEDIDFGHNPQSSFKITKGGKETETTYIDYYRQKYNITIRNRSQPLLITRPSIRDRRAGKDKDQDICLIPELCRATGLTDSMRSDYKLMAALGEHTRLKPNGRIDRLMAFNRRLLAQPEVVKEFDQWQLRLDTQLVQVPARVLPIENMLFANKNESAGRQVEWGRCLQKAKHIVSTRMSDWVLVFPNRIRRDADTFFHNIMEVARGMQFSVNQPVMRELRGDGARDYVEELESIMRQKNPQLVCCIAPRQRADVYAAIKQKCCVDRPVPSQVVLSKNISSKISMSVATKIAVQMSCKIGGAPWSLHFGFKNLEGGIMIVGFDVCHDPNRRGTDYGAMVASLDPGMSRYFSAVTAHKNNEELTNEFTSNMIKAIRKYAELNSNTFPARIIIYRDGVGDGQIPYVVDHELKHLREHLDKFYAQNPVKMAFIIVTKRINVRLFLNKRDNPPPGTVVDDVITNPSRYDFFLVSQFVRNGSVSPSAYNVIYDTVGFDVSAIQQLTYRLTHMYFNYCSTIRVPAPCQYAHKLAFLVAQSIHKSPSSHLENLLYFL
ncbi:piwi-like protein Siwi isoform X2 [Chelonus insularis]|uniref:piwi-like protein Siwi isoform X2 n=1 Tax=Chelonus insularis TaxID=460826 RepID=UPI00158E8CF8|nr:piwi-like protein Siwi isoform X2 [Chelonus insularis]